MAGIAEEMGCRVTDLPALAPEAEAEAEAALARSFARHRNLRRLRAQIEEFLGVAAEAALAASH